MSAREFVLENVEQSARAAYRGGFNVRASSPRLRAALQETLDSPGNLTRLRLGLIAGHALQQPESATRAMAVAFEYFHTASLLFDDLPCMDDASDRRGRPCLHTRHGESSAVLAALAFINRAYALLWQALSSGRNDTRNAAIRHAEKCLGDAGVLDGQSLDLDFAASDGSPNAVARAAMGKTVALLRLTLVTPALHAGVSPRETILLDRLAVYWGLAYQIADDCGDLSGFHSGKTSGRDALLGRPNFAIAAGAVGTVHQLGRLLTLIDMTLDRLVIIRGAWSALLPLVTHLARSAPAPAVEAETRARQCA